VTEPVAGPLRTSRDGTKRQLVTTEFLILIIAGVAGASAVFGFALCFAGVGAGLGLSLVKSFVELHGGDVELTSAPNEGTAIICRLPANPRANPGPEHEHDA